MFDPFAAGAKGAASERINAHRVTARRVLEELLHIDSDTVDLSDATTLSDLAPRTPAEAASASSERARSIRLKERVFALYGIDCEADEPLVDMLVRLETAEHGVRFVRQE